MSASFTTLFQETVVLENDLALLRPLTVLDASLLEPVAYEPSLWQIGMRRISNRAELELYIQLALEERARGASYPFVIIDKKTGRAAGSTRYMNIVPVHKRLEIGGTWLHPDFQRTGLNRACKYLLLRFAFETLHVNRVEINTDVLNHQSRAAIRAIGATEEGILRQHAITYTGRVRDTVYHSILHSEWPVIRRTIFSKFNTSAD